MSFAYAVFNGALGLTQRSYWYFTMGVYFFVLFAVKGEAFFLRRNGEGCLSSASLKRSGIMMILLAVVVSGIIVLEIREKRNPAKDMRVMIGMAAFLSILALGLNLVFHGKRQTKSKES